MSNNDSRAIMAENIKRNLDRKGINMKELSIQLDVPYTTVSGWCNAKTYPRIDKIERMAELFGINKAELIESQEAMSYVKGPGTYYMKAIQSRPYIETLFLLAMRATDEEHKKYIEVLRTLLGDRADGI